MEIEAPSMKKFLVSRFSVYENDAALRHWSREPITTLSAPSMCMSRFIRTDYHAGQIFIPHRHLFLYRKSPANYPDILAARWNIFSLVLIDDVINLHVILYVIIVTFCQL